MYLKNLFVILINLFTLLLGLSSSAFAASYTDVASWEADVPLGAPVTEVTFAGTPGATVADGTAFTGFSLSSYYGMPMAYDSDGTSICIDGGGTYYPRIDINLEADATYSLAVEFTSALGTGELAVMDSGSAIVEYQITSGGFNGIVTTSEIASGYVQGDGGYTDVVCINAVYLVLDTDGDGDAADVDCNDTDAAAYPGATEICDSIDNDCDGGTDEDLPCTDDDGDGYSELDGDCDDGDPAINPAATEIAYDGIDQDCDGSDLTDVDGDGYDSVAVSGGDDCNDVNAGINPGATEICNAIDDDCDGSIDEDFVDSDGDGYPDCIDEDSDGDGFTPAEGDCDDGNPAINPAATEIAYDGIDQDCDGADLTDVDGDGWDMAEGDCDDAQATINPDAAEICNGIDDDCDGLVDGDDGDAAGTSCYDDDGDGLSEDEGDCDDANATVYPGAEEVLDDGIDQDCDGEDETSEPETDLDGDGYSDDDGDCDDTDATVYPGAEEILDDGIDQDCDGEDETSPIVIEDPEREGTLTGGGGFMCSASPSASVPGSLAWLCGLISMMVAYRRKR